VPVIIASIAFNHVALLAESSKTALNAELEIFRILDVLAIVKYSFIRTN
jgi:hypothetical protein